MVAAQTSLSPIEWMIINVCHYYYMCLKFSGDEKTKSYI